jgi:hypothetical protein
MRLANFVLGLAFLLPARAATVAVLVRERGGGPIAEQRVDIQPTVTPGELPVWVSMRMQSRVTGEDGKAVFESVPVGRYTVSLGRIAQPGLINPAANPLAPPPQLTIAAEGDKVPVVIEVWRGSLLSGEVIVDRAGIPRGAKVVLRSLDGQPDVDLPLDLKGRVERLLLPGRYETELVIPPGYLLVDLVWNGESLPGHIARFDVREDPRTQNVSWYLSTPCLITGKVSDASGECPVRVVATLDQPGPWILAATQRGGSTFQVVPHQEWVANSRCVYRLWLPDGQWTVRPQGEDLLRSEPETVDVTIAPGETRTLDFQLTTKEEDNPEKGQPLIVSVWSPEGRPAVGAIVEVWPPGEDRLSGDPLKTGKTEGYAGSVRFAGLAAGNYLVAAGREDFLEGTAKVEDHDPKAKEPTRVTVTLRQGAKLHAHAQDDRDHPVQGVELSYERLSPLPKMVLANAGIAAKKRLGTALSDLTGHSEIPGLYSGDYRVEARMTGEQSATRFVLARQGSAKHTRSIEVRLTEGERSDVDLLVLPAASLSGGLACSDKSTMPAKVSFRIFPADSRVEDLWRDKKLTSGAVSAPDDVLLRGIGADRFHLGPLSPGEYHLAVRPDGQDYWSFASNELTPDRATILPVEEAAPLDTGVVEIECGPLVAIVPEIRSKEPLPDLHLGAVRATLRPAREEKGRRAVSANVEVHAERAFLRRLPEGKFQTSVTVEHPYLIPPSVSVPERELDLIRGKLAEIHVTFDRLGGLVEVRGDGKAARLTPGDGSPLVRPVADGTAAFPGTLPGTYRVELCGDPDCSAVTASWMQVVVLAGRTTFLP